jgi:predicted metal-dependent HD superfamily phosphohydrolase
MNVKFRQLLEEGVSYAQEFGIDITVEEVIKRYSENHRFWHTLEHLEDVMLKIYYLLGNTITWNEYKILLVVAIFHDIVYDPKRKDNEEKSVEYMRSCIYGLSSMNVLRVSFPTIKEISDIILATKHHKSKERLSVIFNSIDTSVIDEPFQVLIEWEDGIYNEFKWVGKEEYKKGRLDFLENYALKNHPYNKNNLMKLIDYVNKKY